MVYLAMVLHSFASPSLKWVIEYIALDIAGFRCSNDVVRVLAILPYLDSLPMV